MGNLRASVEALSQVSAVGRVADRYQVAFCNQVFSRVLEIGEDGAMHCSLLGAGLFFARGSSLPSRRARVVNSIVGRNDLVSHGEAGVSRAAPHFQKPTA